MVSGNKIPSETVWNDGAQGGFSLPDWQDGLMGHADRWDQHRHWWNERCSPLWATFIARNNAARGNNPVGFINPQFYASPQVLNDITQGNNGDFAATPGWDSCTALEARQAPRWHSCYPL
jgi:kumamolisin